MKLEVNKKLLPLKAHFFLYNGGVAPVLPFISVVAKQLGYTATSVGFIYLITSIVGLVFRPLLGAISDRFKIQKPMLLCLQVLTIILFVSTLFVPSLPSKAEFQCAEHENVMTVCPPNLNQNDECTIDDIVNNPSEASFGCQMKCTKNDLWSTICGYWNVPGLCESTDNRVVIDTTVVHNRVELEDDCFHLPFNNGSIDNNAAHLHCPVKESVMNCDVKCDDEFVAQVLLGVTDSEARASYQYWMFFTLLVVGYTCMAFIVSVSDAICFGMLDDKPQHYGRQRLWGAIGNSIVGLISGIIIDTVSEGQAVKNYTIAFSIFAGFLLLDVLVISRLKHTQTEVTKTVVKDVAKLFKSVRVVVFFLWCIVLGFAFAMMWGFLFWHLEILGAQQGCGFGNYMKTLQGFVMGVGLLASLPLLIYSGKLIQKIGHIHAMSLVLFMFGLRFFLYSLLKNPWYVLPIELLDGLSVSLFYVCMTSYASLIAPAGTEATLQGLVGAIFEGFGYSAGSYLAGYLMDLVGGSVTFRIFSYGAFFFFVLHELVHWLINRFDPPPAKPLVVVSVLENKEKDVVDDSIKT